MVYLAKWMGRVIIQIKALLLKIVQVDGMYDGFCKQIVNRMYDGFCKQIAQYAYDFDSLLSQI